MKAAAEKTRGYRRLIPSMTALVEFEAVARLSSFTLAAHELGVTQAAVSRQVKALEETLGVQLFHRLHRAIRLTREGEALQQVVGFVAQINLRASRPNPQTDLSHADRLRCAQGCKAI